MTKRKAIHVAPHPDGGWQVKREGAGRASSRHTTQRDALSKARGTAKREGLELIIHNKDGKIMDRDSYGPDPHPLIRTVKKSARTGKIGRVAARRAVRAVTRGKH